MGAPVIWDDTRPNGISSYGLKATLYNATYNEGFEGSEFMENWLV